MIGVTGWWWWYDDGYRGMTREEALFTVPSGVTSSILGLIFPKNTSSNHPTNMQMNLFCPVSPPGLSALMFCCRALLSCSCLCLCKACCCACLHIGPGDGLETLPTAGPFLCQWLFGTHLKEPASQPLRAVSRELETYSTALPGLDQDVPMTFLSWERADVVGSKLMYWCKPGASTQTWSGRGSWNKLVQEICHQLCFPSDLRGLLGRVESPLAQNPKKAYRGTTFSFAKSEQRKVSVMPSDTKI